MSIFSTKKRSNLVMSMILLFLSSIVFTGCNSGSSVGTATPDVSALAKDTTLNLEIVDATGLPVDMAKVEVTADSANIIAAGEESQNTDGDIGGLVTYDLNSFTGTQQKLQLRVTKEGYTSNNIPVDVINGEDNTQRISITKIGEDVAGINSTSKNWDISTGPLTVVTSGENSGDTTVIIDQDTGATTADGTPLSNLLNVDVVQYGPGEDAALDAFPGGFAVSLENPDALAADGISALDNEPVVDGEVTLQSTGFTVIEVRDDQGNIAKNFSKPIRVSSKIQDTVINPETDLPVKVGDTLPLWSFDTTTGKWSYEQIATVVSDGVGGLKIDYQVTHLSCWNHGHYSARRCNATLTFNDLNPNPQPLIGRLSGRGWTRTFQTDGSATSSVAIRRAPSRFDVNLRLKTFDGVPVAVDPSRFNLCNPRSHSFNIESPAIAKYDLSVNVSTYCSNDGTVADVAVPHAYVRVYSLATHRSVSGRTDSDGNVNFNLPPGKYIVIMFTRYPDRTFLKQVVTISDSGEEVSFRIPQTCDIPTGATGATGATGSTGSSGAAGD